MYHRDVEVNAFCEASERADKLIRNLVQACPSAFAGAQSARRLHRLILEEFYCARGDNHAALGRITAVLKERSLLRLFNSASSFRHEVSSAIAAGDWLQVETLLLRRS